MEAPGGRRRTDPTGAIVPGHSAAARTDVVSTVAAQNPAWLSLRIPGDDCRSTSCLRRVQLTWLILKSKFRRALGRALMTGLCTWAQTEVKAVNIQGLLVGVSAFAAAIAFGVGAAQADTVTATLSAQYYQVADGSDPDFNLFSTPNVLNGSSLGPNGLPVATAPFGVNDVNPTTHEITWWSPALNPHVSATGTGTISLPFASNMYPPNSTGGNDSSFFETAVFKGVFNLSAPGTVEFQLGSDDDSFIYVDGVLFGQNPGVHGVTNVDFTSSMLNAGNHNITVFYADRENTGAFLSLNLLSSGIIINPGVPEPATWAMMLMGFGGLGAALRARRRQASAVA